MRIQFVSDIACPWCAIGFASLEQALARIGNSIPVDLRFEPYELNPTMAREGTETVPYLMQKYGRTAEQVAQSRARIREHGAAVGFTFGERTWVWNTFDAHRLLYWAGLEGRQVALKRALLAAYHTRDENPSDPEVLKRLCGEVGLDAERAGAILASSEFGQAVREREAHFQRLGISGVPAVIVDEQHLIQGGQPPEVFEQAIRRLARNDASSGGRLT